MSETGNRCSIEMGVKLAEMNIDITKITCSGQKRAILSAKYFREGYIG